MAKTKKVYWNTVLAENYRFQYQATRDAEPVQRTGTLTFSQTYGTGVKDNGKKILVLSLRYPVGPILAIPGIACDHIDRIWKFQIDDLSDLAARKNTLNGIQLAVEHEHIVFVKREFPRRFFNKIPAVGICSCRRFLHEDMLSGF